MREGTGLRVPVRSDLACPRRVVGTSTSMYYDEVPPQSNAACCGLPLGPSDTRNLNRWDDSMELYTQIRLPHMDGTAKFELHTRAADVLMVTA
jgi:hypothetical protein